MKDPEDDCVDYEDSEWTDLGDGDWIDVPDSGVLSD